MKHYNWKADAVRGGHAYHVDVGAFSSGITGGGNGTIIDQDQPEAIISCPDGYTIMPIRVKVTCKTPLIAADNNESEILIAVDVAAAAAGTTGIAGATSETAVNMHTGSSNTTACSCYSASTANWTNPTLGLELDRMIKNADVQGTAATALWGDLVLDYQPEAPPILTGPCALYVYWGGTVAMSGFAQIEWVEEKDA